jgi:hypothetical protein
MYMKYEKFITASNKNLMQFIPENSSSVVRISTLL